jgi:ABC-type glutathione transport system ATPase component
MADAPIVEVRGLKKTFMVSHAGGTSPLNALDDVNFDVMPGETLGLVGESGSGKSTAGRVLVGLIPATAGTVSVFGRRITGRDGAAALRAVRSRLQFVFQDPYAALNPRMRVGSSVAEPLEIAGKLSRRDRSDRVAELFELVGLPKISIARAQSGVHCLRRAGLGARCLDAGPDCQSADGFAAAAGPDLSLHCP